MFAEAVGEGVIGATGPSDPTATGTRFGPAQAPRANRAAVIVAMIIAVVVVRIVTPAFLA